MLVRRARNWLAVLVLLVPVGVLVASPAYASCPVTGVGAYPVLTGTLQLNGAPASGAQLVASGSGFRPRSPICIEVAATSLQIATVFANREGGFATSIVVPALPTGQHILRATGSTRDGSALILNTAFTNGYALPNAGLRVGRWVMLAVATAGLVALLAFGRRRARASRTA
jgi:hypothetical protein